MQNASIIKEYLLSQNKELTLTNSTNLIDEGIINSFQMVNLMFYIEKEFGIDIFAGEVYFDCFQTIDSICSLISLKQKEKEKGKE